MKQCTLLAIVLLLSCMVNLHADISKPPFPKPANPKQPVSPQPLPAQPFPAQPAFPQQPLPLQLVPIEPGLPQQLPQVNPAVGSRNAELVVEIDPQAKTARLQIPINLVGGRGNRRTSDAGGIPALVAGLALSCAIVSGGFWLVRRGRGRALAAVLFYLSLLATVGSVSANIGPGPRPKKDLPPPNIPVQLPAGIQLSNKIIVEVVPFGTKLRLIITKDMAPNTEKNDP
jgi:hypothetical protein